MTPTRWNQLVEAACLRAARHEHLARKAALPVRLNTEGHLLFNGMYESECPVCSQFANYVTPAPAPMADTSNNGAHVAPAGGSKMFRDTENAVICAIVAAAMLAALILSAVF